MLDELRELVVASAFADGEPATAPSMRGPPAGSLLRRRSRGQPIAPPRFRPFGSRPGSTSRSSPPRRPATPAGCSSSNGRGTIKILDLATGAISVFLDISDQVSTVGEGGLLGLAFDPNYAENGYFYVDLTNTSGDTEVRRYQVSAGDPNIADPSSMTPIISVDQPDGRTNHKAGWIGFGPDGNLYIALGDGGGGGDPDGNAQNGATLLGKMLRLDVHADDFPTDPARNYAVPADNPFVGTAGVLPEIWALGLRNPFRNSFDRATGQLYIADVGQGEFEEIDLGQPGANYGWDVFEGPAPFEPGPLGPGTLTDPIHSYDHSVGSAVIGGYVYRGPDAALQGKYFFADEVTGKVFTLEQQGTTWVATDQTAEIAPDFGAIGNPTSFAEDAQGNLYIIDFDGEVFRLGSAAVPCFCAGTLIAYRARRGAGRGAADRRRRADAGRPSDGGSSGSAGAPMTRALSLAIPRYCRSASRPGHWRTAYPPATCGYRRNTPFISTPGWWRHGCWSTAPPSARRAASSGCPITTSSSTAMT